MPTRSSMMQAFGLTLAGLCAAIAPFARGAMGPLLARVWSYINRTTLRLDHLALRWQAGTLPKRRTPKPRQPRTAPAHPAPAQADQRPPRLPRGKFWLIKLAQPTVQYRSQVEGFLADPDTIRFVQAAPQAGRLLRPLCHALGITLPAYLQRPPRPAKPRKPKPPRPPRPKLAPLRPLPAYVRAAVRAWKPRYG